MGLTSGCPEASTLDAGSSTENVPDANGDVIIADASNLDGGTQKPDAGIESDAGDLMDAGIELVDAGAGFFDGGPTRITDGGSPSLDAGDEAFKT
ncbi:MAG: hypothetical protein GY822_17080 [Deltaproteobacteria bacterium]|nr:hypothetical protein [Deltaproteobacteria bacterium]